jgi:segregation and condensation protein B
MTRRAPEDDDGSEAAADETPAPPGGFVGPPSDGGLSIDRLAQAFAAMMGGAEGEAPAADDVVRVDATPDLDAAEIGADDAARVNPLSILEALLFVGLPGGRPLGSRIVAGLMRGVRPEEVDELARELGRRYRADNCPYEVVPRGEGWLLRLRDDHARFGLVLESRARSVRLDADSLEMLALVAWHQPVPRDRLVELGCDARPATLRQLVRRGLLERRRPAAGEGEATYHTTPRFLEVFGLQSLDDLPDPSEPPA